MRAWEFLNINENRQPSSKPITLKALHSEKLALQAKEKEDRERAKLMPLIYGDMDRHRERLEIQRLELELLQLRQELKDECDSATYKAIGKMAQAGIDAKETVQKKIAKQARSGLGRSLKKAP